MEKKLVSLAELKAIRQYREFYEKLENVSLSRRVFLACDVLIKNNKIS